MLPCLLLLLSAPLLSKIPLLVFRLDEIVATASAAIGLVGENLATAATEADRSAAASLVAKICGDWMVLVLLTASEVVLS